jgi:hypothetical protein
MTPDTVIPGARYALFLVGPAPTGTNKPPIPGGLSVPDGDTFWAQGMTDAEGTLTFWVPSGHAWCLAELGAPDGYQTDDALHCTAVITTETPTKAATIALPEVPTGAMLAFTGSPSVLLLAAGVTLLGGGAGIQLAARRARRPSRSGDGA